ncbi:hypothetical protein GGR52DRAFT_137964 [Hypoxylon sp. FL1284]|nr:hypothetical protein GGR52DRAFT_137964 [Hypoxylon sp. FL1284]
MASNETPHPPVAETNRDEITPVSAPTSTTMPGENREPVNETAPPLPMRPTRVPTGHLPPSAPQQPVPQQQPYAQFQQMPFQTYPYQGQQYPCMRALPPYSKPWTVTKLVLTIFTTMLGIIIIGLSCVFVAEEGDGAASAYYSLPIAVLSVLWNGAELITFCVRARKDVQRGIHPGAHVGMDLVFWIAGVFGVLFSVMVTISLEGMIMDCERAKDSSYGYWSYCDDYHYQDDSYMNDMYLPTLRAVVAMFCLFTITHFVLFVMACIETHRRNCLKPAGIVVPPAMAGMYYPPPPPPGAAPYYPYPMPMAPQQARVVPEAQAPNAAAAQNYQNYQSLAGFYAPAPDVAPQRAPGSPTRAAPGQMSEKAVASTSGSAGQAV